MSKGGGGGGSGNTTTTVQPPQFEVPYIANFLKMIAGLSSQPYSSFGFPNEQIAPLNPLEMQGLGMAPGEAAQMQGLDTSALNQANQTLQGDFLVPPQRVQDAINRQTMQEYNQTAAPSEMSAAAQAGAFGGSADAEARAMNQFNLTTALADPAYALYGQERQNQLEALKLTPLINEAAAQPGQTLLQAGGVEQSQQQNELNALYQNLFQKANFPFFQADLLGSALGTAGGGSGTTTQRTSGGGTDPLALGLGLGGLGLAGAGTAFGSSALTGLGAILPLIAAFL